MPEPPASNPDDQPPILGTWRNLYLAVLVLHAIIIFLFYVFTHWYAF